jgi:hypothetical protein
MSQARYQKQLRERARREKAEAKRDRREARLLSAASEPPQPAASEPDVLAKLAALHETFAQGGIDFDEFERVKHELISQLND